MKHSTDAGTVPEGLLPEQWCALAALILAETVDGASITMIFPALVTLFHQFGGPAAAGWLVTSFFLVSIVAASIGARLGDVYGRDRVLVIAMLLSATGALIGGIAGSLAGLIVARCLQAACAACMPLSFGLIREHFPRTRASLGVGLVAGASALASGLGIVLAGHFVDSGHWQYMFIAVAIVAFSAIGMIMLFVPKSQRTVPGQLDIPGGVLLIAGLAGPLLAITFSRSWGLTDSRTIGLFVAGLIVLGFWARYESRQAHPLIDVKLLGNRNILLANACVGFGALGSMQSSQVFIVLLQQPKWTGVGLGLSATMAGLLKLPSSGLGFLSASWGGHIAGRRGGRSGALIGTVLMAIGWGLAWYEHESAWVVVIYLLIITAGTMILVASVPNIISTVAPMDRTSEANGLSIVCRASCMALGAQLVAACMAASTISDPAQGPGNYPSAVAYSTTIGLIFTSCLITVAVAWALPKASPKFETGAREARQ